MKKNTIRKYAERTALLAMMAVMHTGCIMDEEQAEMKETTLTLTFSTRAPGDTGSTTGPESGNEHMRTLRVILAETDGTIRYNTKITGIPEDATDQKVTFSELITVENGETTFDVYAIANEEAFVTSPDQLAAQTGNISDMNLENLTLDKDVLAKLNLGLESNNLDNQEYRLPQTAKAEVTVEPGKENSATIQLEFVVAKVDLTFINQSVQDITMNKLTFSSMDVSSTPLLPLNSNTLPDNGNDKILSNIHIPGNGTHTETFYVYESRVTGNDEYILSTDWGNGNSLNLTENGLGTSFTRGTKLDVDVTLNSQQEVDLVFVVVPWDEVDADVSFQ